MSIENYKDFGELFWIAAGFPHSPETVPWDGREEGDERGKEGEEKGGEGCKRRCAAAVGVLCAAVGILVSILAGTPVGSTVVAADIAAFLLLSAIGTLRK